MPKILLTAFEPYDVWSENASWLALVELTKEMPPGIDITTRRYPVDFTAVKERLAEDLPALLRVGPLIPRDLIRSTIFAVLIIPINIHIPPNTRILVRDHLVIGHLHLLRKRDLGPP